MFVSIFKPANQAHRARFALNPEQMLTMFGHKLPVKGDRLDISAGSGMVKLTANPKGRFALSNAHSVRRPGFVTILASEVGMTRAKALGMTVPTKNGGKSVGASIPLRMRTGIKTPAPTSAKRPAKKTAAKTKPKAKTARKASLKAAKKTVKATTPTRKMRMAVPKKAAPKRTTADRKMGAALKKTASRATATARPATTMLGDAVSKLNKILAVTPTARVTTKNNRVLVTAERKVIVAYI